MKSEGKRERQRQSKSQEVIRLKREYETPDIYIEEYELENILGNLCSGVDEIPIVGPGTIE